MVEAAITCTDLIRANRMVPKPTSCAALVQPGRMGQWVGGRAEEAGFSLLGAPIGTAEYRLNTCRTHIHNMTHSVPALQHLHPQSSYILLKSCFNVRPCYLERVCEPVQVQEALEAFDVAIDRATAMLALSPMTATLSAMRSLPLYLGGLGIKRRGGFNSLQACTHRG